MNKKAIISLYFLLAGFTVYAQKYSLSKLEKEKIKTLKASSKSSLLNSLIKTPNATESYLMSNGKISFIADSKKGEVNLLLEELLKLGAKDCAQINGKICGKININQLDAVERLASLKSITPEFRPHLNLGRVTGEGSRSMLTNTIQNKLGFTGKGVKIGILSDSYNNLGGAVTGVAHGDLPGKGNPNGYNTPVNVLKDLSYGSGSDEGRAMAELIHEVAPNAELFFYTAFEGLFDFAAGIRALEAVGCDIIVDDVFYNTENYFQDGVVGRAVNEVAKKGVTYFSSAGNNASVSFENRYIPTQTIGVNGGLLMDFGGNNTDQRLEIPAYSSIALWIMWDDTQPIYNDIRNPYPKTDLDAYLYNARNKKLLTSSTFNNITQGLNMEIIEYTNSNAYPIKVDLIIEKVSGINPRRIKYIDREQNIHFIDRIGTNAGTCVGHANVKNCIAVGAASYYDTTEFNDFRLSINNPYITNSIVSDLSSSGGTPILIASDGTKTKPLVTENPFIVGPDGVNNSFFGSDIDFDNDNFPNFFGTSANAPLVAAAASLFIEAKSGITTKEIKDAMKNTAKDMDNPITRGFDAGYDFKTGYGFINAFDAISEILNGEFPENEVPKETEPKEEKPKETDSDIVVTAFPSPFKNKLRLGLNSPKREDITVEIFSFSGQKVYAKNFILKNRRIVQSINLWSHPKGLYFIKVFARTSRKLLINKSIVKT